ncbi:hypothetical protein SDJN03_04941, partial [Cucurbita argyrosperma subsp. sororia]
MENGFGMRLMHSTLTPRIAPSLILDSGASKMAGMMTVTGSGSGRRTAAISREFRKDEHPSKNRGPDTPDEASLVPAWNTRYEE